LSKVNSVHLLVPVDFALDGDDLLIVMPRAEHPCMSVAVEEWTMQHAVPPCWMWPWSARISRCQYIAYRTQATQDFMAQWGLGACLLRYLSRPRPIDGDLHLSWGWDAGIYGPRALAVAARNCEDRSVCLWLLGVGDANRAAAISRPRSRGVS